MSKFEEYWKNAHEDLEHETGEGLAEIVFNDAYGMGQDKSIEPLRDMVREDCKLSDQLEKDALELAEFAEMGVNWKAVPRKAREFLQKYQK